MAPTITSLLRGTPIYTGSIQHLSGRTWRRNELRNASLQYAYLTAVSVAYVTSDNSAYHAATDPSIHFTQFHIEWQHNATMPPNLNQNELGAQTLLKQGMNLLTFSLSNILPNPPIHTQSNHSLHYLQSIWNCRTTYRHWTNINLIG